MDRASELMWERIASLGAPGPYDLYGALRFLDHVPDRERAADALQHVEGPLREVVTLDPEATGEVHGPLGFAPAPGLDRAPPVRRRRPSPRTSITSPPVSSHDGGWTFNFPAWSPAQEADWRGFVTVDALDTLRRNERPL